MVNGRLLYRSERSNNLVVEADDDAEEELEEDVALVEWVIAVVCLLLSLLMLEVMSAGELTVRDSLLLVVELEDANARVATVFLLARSNNLSLVVEVEVEVEAAAAAAAAATPLLPLAEAAVAVKVTGSNDAARSPG